MTLSYQIKITHLIYRNTNMLQLCFVHSQFNMGVWLPLCHMFHISECRTLIVYFYCKGNKTFPLNQMIFFRKIFVFFSKIFKMFIIVLSFCGVHSLGSVNVSMRLINFAIEQNTLVMKMHASILRKCTRFPSK